MRAAADNSQLILQVRELRTAQSSSPIDTLSQPFAKAKAQASMLSAMMSRRFTPDRAARQGAHTSRLCPLQVDGDLQSFRQDALQLGQHEAGTPDADDGVVER